MVIFLIYISTFSNFISSAEGKRRSSTQAKRRQHALKGQKFIAQGIALGIIAISKAPCKGKSFQYQAINKAFALTGRQVCVRNYPGRCPGLRASAPSGRVGLTCETCIYKISYQILLGFTVECELMRKKFFYEKKYQSIIFWQNVEINC